MCVCNPTLVTTFPELLSGTKPWPHTPGAVRPSSCVCSVLRAHVQFCRFDKADASTDVQCHCTTDHHPDTTIFQLRVCSELEKSGMHTLVVVVVVFQSPNDVPPEPQRNVSIAAVRGTVRPL